jgi:DNA-binding response OmpR family regulator
MGPLPLTTDQHNYQDEHVIVDFARQEVLLDGARLRLTRKEFELLSMMVQHAGDIVPRAVLLMNVWGYGAGIRTRTLDVHVRRLRRKLGTYAERYVETIFGIGYRFQPYRPARFPEQNSVKPLLAFSA